jgi:hypothetical protein
MKNILKAWLMVWVFWGLLPFLATPSYAMRCGTKLISVGDFSPRVLAECGEPTHVERWQEERVFRDFRTYDDGYDDDDGRRYRQPFLVKEQVLVERWIYNFGSHRLIRQLIFENGKLVRITTGAHGY